MRWILFVSIISLCAFAQSSPNDILTIDWTNSPSTCSALITQNIQTSTIYGNAGFPLQQTHVCLEDGTTLKISDCSAVAQKKINVLPYFISLPNNDMSKQCACQAKCAGLRSSYYTMKFYISTQAVYFTTSNPCVAFCNKGYEIYPSSFALNSFPANNAASLTKPFDTACYDSLNDGYLVGVQMEQMKIQYCKADIMCDTFIDTYTQDIQDVEARIYGQKLPYTHVLTAAQKYWVKQQTTATCADTMYDGKQKVCIDSNSAKTAKMCFYKSATVTQPGGGSKILKYVGAVSQVYNCVTDGQLMTQDLFYVDTAVECICKHYSANFELLTVGLADFYGTSNDKYARYGSSNYFRYLDNKAIDYAKIESASNVCECNNIEYIYDYFCTAVTFATCEVSKTGAVPMALTSDEEKYAYMLKLAIHPPDLVLGYTDQKCKNLNTICNKNSEHTPRCMIKLFSAFPYPIVKQDSAFVACAEEYSTNSGNNRLNYYFGCPSQAACNSQTCLMEFFDKCKVVPILDDSGTDLCEKFSSSCASNCARETQKQCIVDTSTGSELILSSYELCVRQCSGANFEILCASDSNCDVPTCKTLYCDDCVDSGSSSCGSKCGCQPNDTSCLCEKNTCSGVDNVSLDVCIYTNGVSVSPYKVTRQSKCTSDCKSNSANTTYVVCADCGATQQSCCSAYCTSKDDTSNTHCVTIDGGPKLITERQICSMKCQGNTVTELSSESCNTSCASRCAPKKDSTITYYSYDTFSSKRSMTDYEYCLYKCDNVNAVFVNCTNLNDYQCFSTYCNECMNGALGSAGSCPSECQCASTAVSSMSQCSCYMSTCVTISDQNPKMCLRKNGSYELIEQRETCLSRCTNYSAPDFFSCKQCKSSADCCKQSCSQDANQVCVEYGGTYFHTSRNDVCNKLCDNTVYTIQPEVTCCINNTQSTNGMVCVKSANSQPFEQSVTQFCTAASNGTGNSAAIVPYSSCCIDSCLKRNEQTFCVQGTEGYKMLNLQEYCTASCSGAQPKEASAELCCESTCNKQALTHAAGSYCDNTFKLYGSWLEYCISTKCSNSAPEVVLCNVNGPCTISLCKTKLSEKLCLSHDATQTITIDKEGKCTVYDSWCNAQLFKNVLDMSFKCRFADIQECLNDPELFTSYRQQLTIQEPLKFCRGKSALSLEQLTFEKNCRKSPQLKVEVCGSSKCDDEICTSGYCSRLCKPTNDVYWDDRCVFFSSRCEAECNNSVYYDLFNAQQFFKICNDNADAKRRYRLLLALKQHVCDMTEEVEYYASGYPRKNIEHIDCMELKSTDLADCRGRCRSWVALRK